MYNTELLYQNFITRIQQAGKKDIIIKLAGRLAVLISTLLSAVLIMVFLEALFSFESGIRKVMLYGLIISGFVLFLIVIIHSYISLSGISNKSVTRKYASQIGNRYTNIKDKLVNAIEIYSSQGKIFSAELISEALKKLDEETKGINFSEIVTFRNIRTELLLISFCVTLSGFLFTAFPSVFRDSLFRIINYNYSFIDNTIGASFEVSPGNKEVPKSEPVELSVRLSFNEPSYSADEVTLHLKEVSAEELELKKSEIKLIPSDLNYFTYKIPSVNTKMVYWFEYRGIRSHSYTISVLQRPVIKSLKVTVFPPAYTRLPSRTIEGNDITTIKGSVIYLEAEASGDLKSAFIEFTSGNRINTETEGNILKASFTALANTEFSLHLINQAGLANLSPEKYNLRVFADEYPSISVTEPESSELNVQGVKELLLRSRISDDFGFSRMRLAYRISKSKYGQTDNQFRFTDISIKNTDAIALEVPYIWNLSSLNLGTEDEVEYYLEVYDNDLVSGPKVSRSEIRKLIYPSLEALMKKTEETRDNIENLLESALQDASDLKKELDEIKDKLERNPEELGLNDPSKNQQLQQKLENIQNSLSVTREKLDELMNELQQQSQISKETLEKYLELQQLFQKIDSKELREALRKLQEAMRNFNKDELREAMKNFKFDEENFKKSLEKTMELLNKILNEQKFGELTEKLNELTKNQDKIKQELKESSDTDKMKELSDKQRKLKEQMSEFQKQFKELTENMKKSGDRQLSKDMQKMLEEMMKKQLEQKMQQASDELQSSNKSKSSKSQEQLSQDMNELNQQMQKMLSDLLDRENSAMQQKMEEFLERMKQMSKRQKELQEKSERLDKNSKEDEFRQNKAEQEALKNQLSNFIEDFMSLSQQMGPNPMMNKNLGDAFNEMQNASDKLGKKDSKGANKSQGKAKEHLDKAIERMEQMCQSGQSGKGSKPSMSLQQLLQKLQEMIQRQQGLNQQMQGMPNGNQGQFSQEQMAEMQRLSLEQEQIRRELGKMNQDVQKMQEMEGKKMLGNLEQIQKDMMEVIKDLQDNSITPETRKRQEKILSRLLDFQLSAREKDFEQRRESRPGKNFVRTSPEEIVISRPNIINGVNTDILQLNRENYTDDYQNIIIKYKKKLNTR
ncbi:MAG: hypothetical protein N2510_06735 [Ignavibacteria bacterium]|nr:hypothetical protein [Ignavibacteria bacterium]